MHSSENASAPIVETQLVYLHGLAAIVMLFVSIGFGFLASSELIAPGLLGDSAWLTWGKLRYDHTQGIMLGWLGNAFFAFLYHAVPLLTGRPVTSIGLGRWLFGLWNFAVVIPGWILVLAGFSQPLEWAEFPLVVDAFVVLALLLAAVQFLPAFFARGLEDLYVSSWYIIGGLVFTLLAYPMGNFVPELVPGARGAAFSGLWIHDAIGLYVTPLALAVIYFVIPAATRRPIFSHFLSMLGFWLLFFLYPLNGTHHYVFSVIPMSAQIGAITASTLLGADVVIVVANLLLSLRGAGWLPRDPALRFVAMGTVFYLIVSIQGSVQAQMSVNQSVHFSDWVVGHSHLAMLGFASFAAAGGLIHAWQRIPQARCNPKLLRWSYWLLAAGVIVMVVDLTAAGLVEARLWQSGAPWIESVRAARPYWLIRTLTAVPISAGFLMLLLGLTTGNRGGGLREVEGSAPHVGAALGSGRLLRMSYLVAGIAGLGFFAMSVLLLGVWPGRVLEEEIAAMSPERPLALTASEQRGRVIYAREGCAYCHTQQVRYLEGDVARYGAATLAWETNFDYPHLWGTRRIGPDLSREASVRSEDWHLAHLYAPRSLAPDSVMPAFAYLFNGAPDRPKQEARDLVAYLETLGRTRELAAPEGESKARASCTHCSEEVIRFAFSSPVLNANPSRSRRAGDYPALIASSDRSRGEQVYRENCAGCHGNRGQGDGPGATGLRPRPPDFTEREYTLNRLGFVLWNGSVGTAMSAWREFPVADVSAVAAVVQGFHVAQPEPQLPADILELGKRVYAEHCAQCHGDNGAGDGWAAGQFTIAATNFREQRPSLAASLRAVRNGVEGTRMGPWSLKLTEAEVSAAAYYVRGFLQGGPRQ